MLFFDLSPSAILMRLALGAGIGFCVGLTGVGGGILGLQATSLVLGLDPIKAVGTTSLYLFLTNIAASFQHIRLRNISWPAVRSVLAGAVPSSIALSLWISHHGDSDGFKAGLETFILFVVFVAIAAMAVNMLKKTVDPDAAGKRISDCKKRQAIGFLFGVFFGAMVGATSVGGGIVLVPALILLGLSSRHTLGSAIFIVMILTCIIALVYGMGGEVERPTAICMAVGSLAGVWQGTRCSVGVSEQTLKKIMLGLIFVIALAMLVLRR